VRGYRPDAATREQLNLPDDEDLVIVPRAKLRNLKG
jgi:hypothetical protein